MELAHLIYSLVHWSYKGWNTYMEKKSCNISNQALQLETFQWFPKQSDFQYNVGKIIFD